MSRITVKGQHLTSIEANILSIARRLDSTRRILTTTTLAAVDLRISTLDLTQAAIARYV